MKTLLSLPFLFFSLLLCGFSANSQVAITGPDCVLAETEYQYNLTGSISSGAQLCITGGKIVGSALNCISSPAAAFVRIIWTGSKGSLTLTTEQGNASVQVTMINSMRAGIISGTTKKQFIEYNTFPPAITCGSATGGSCSPSYAFQWQQSLDNLNWEDIRGATGQNLSSMPQLLQTTFYRRKVTETHSGSIAYSDEAVVYVAADTKGR